MLKALQYRRQRINMMGEYIMALLQPIGYIHQHKLVEKLNADRFDDYGCWSTQVIYPVVKRLQDRGKIVKVYNRKTAHNRRVVIALAELATITTVSDSIDNERHYIHRMTTKGVTIDSRPFCNEPGSDWVENFDKPICRKCAKLYSKVIEF